MILYILIVSILYAQLAFTQEFETKSESKIWSLQDCISYAIVNNITVKGSKLNKGISEVDYRRSKSVKLPNLFGSASRSFSNGTTIDLIASDIETAQIHNTN